MSNMERIESFERFNEGIGKAADRCRELAKVMKNKNWKLIAGGLDGLRYKGGQ